MPYKIVLLIVGCGIGGTESHVLELASRLDQRRYDVVVCSLKPLGPVGRELHARGIRVMSLNGLGKYDPRVLWRLWAMIRQERPDLVQSFLFWANVSARVLCRLTRRQPVVSSYHDEIVSEHWLHRLVDRMTLAWSAKIVCCSHAVQRSVMSKIGGRGGQFEVIPFGVEATQFLSKGEVSRGELGVTNGAPVIGTVCRLVEPKKGLSILLRAVAALGHHPVAHSFQVVLIGEGPAEEGLRSLSRQLNIASRVIFTGPRRDIPQLLPLLDIFVLPSLYEGFGIALLEAMAAGRPVIATAVGGIPEFITNGKTGLLVEPGNVAMLADAIHSLLEDPERAARMACSGQRDVRERYGIESVVRQHEEVYASCLAGASQPPTEARCRRKCKHTCISIS
ncbi:putative Glycosyl transferase group 1 [Nitrospira sp. KM1]|uniref:glycosyltransferase n=1 Tax=Nitrospira sp. KM1 TaxID=1936990 RepID=UPI0013A75880|nr:glycosyltransferase [Nitrospira sp. KM1]BCA54459.1 putative Glycosyl transferase group 1 [Nitrospira sp. KM1]